MTTAFAPANSLEAALKQAAEDPAARPAFLRELLDAKVLIVPAGDKPAIVGGVVAQDSKIGIATVEFGGRPCVPFFTSEARLPAGTDYLLLDAKAFFEITRGAYLVMNPGAAYGKEFFPEEVAGLLDGSAFAPREPYVAEKPTQVLLGQPSDYPHEMVAALARLYAGEPAVKRAWIAFYHNPERDSEGGLLVCLDLADASQRERVSGQSGIVIESVPRRHKFVDLVQYEGSGLTNYFTGQKPFYERGVLKSLWRRIKG